MFRENHQKRLQVVAHLDLIEKTMRQTKDMGKMGNKTNEIGVNKTGEESSGMEEQDNSNQTKASIIWWNGLSQSWEHIKGIDN